MTPCRVPSFVLTNIDQHLQVIGAQGDRRDFRNDSVRHPAPPGTLEARRLPTLLTSKPACRVVDFDSSRARALSNDNEEAQDAHLR